MQASKESGLKRWIPLMLFLIASYSAGFIGSFATNEGMSFWYQTLQRPSWNPPNWVFAPVWTILYFFMGYAAWLVWSTRQDGPKGAALTLFFVQLVFNALWSWLFFAWHQLMWSFIEISAMWVLILITMVLFFRIKSVAGWLLVPYLAWVTFAAALNFAIWQMNS